MVRPQSGFALCLAMAVAIGSLATPRPVAPAAARPVQQNDLVDALMAALTPEQRVGQLALVNFVGADASPGTAVAALVRDYGVGAVLLSASNGNVINTGDTPGQVATLANDLQRRASETGNRSVAGQLRYPPLLIAVDNEGDFYPFSNITHDFTPLPSAMTIGATWKPEHAEAVGSVTGRELSAAGVNLLLGPVVDVLDRPRSGGSGDMGVRSFGGSAGWVGTLGRAFVRGVVAGSRGRMATVAKHFSGHGGSDRSPDNEVAMVNKSLEQLRESELLPFAALAADIPSDAAGRTDAVMTSHISYRGFQSVDPFTKPLSFDQRGLQAAMSLPEFSAWRKQGVIVSDALGVLAVKKHYSPTLTEFPNRQIARDALMAGNDVLSLVEFSQERGWAEHQAPSIIDTLQYLAGQYRESPALRSRVDDALRRVLTLKAKLYPELTLASVLVDPAAASATAGQGHAVVAAVAEDALTLISPSEAELRVRLPRGPRRGERILIVECWADCFPYRIVPQFEIRDAMLRFYGAGGTGEIRREDIDIVAFGELLQWVNGTLSGEAQDRIGGAVTRADYVVLALPDYNPTNYPASEAARRFLDAAAVDLRTKRVIAVAFNAPYHLDATQIGKLTAYFGVYSKTPEAIDAAVRAIFRQLEPHGSPPVSIAGVGYDLPQALQPDSQQQLSLSVERSGPEARVQTSVIRDRQGRLAADGTQVQFSVAQRGVVVSTLRAPTLAGVASIAVPSEAGEYRVQAQVGSVTSTPLTGGRSDVAGSRDSGAGIAWPWGIPFALALAAAAFAGWTRRRTPPTATAAAGPSPNESPPAALQRTSTGLTVDPATRTVAIEGRAVSPALSPEQYRLVAYLHERAGAVCTRDEVVAHVWPDAHAEGVSEEALDALVRRVRERLTQAGATRRHLVTVRGHGLRLDP